MLVRYTSSCIILTDYWIATYSVLSKSVLGAENGRFIVWGLMNTLQMHPLALGRLLHGTYKVEDGCVNVNVLHDTTSLKTVTELIFGSGIFRITGVCLISDHSSLLQMCLVNRYCTFYTSTDHLMVPCVRLHSVGNRAFSAASPRTQNEPVYNVVSEECIRRHLLCRSFPDLMLSQYCCDTTVDLASFSYTYTTLIILE